MKKINKSTILKKCDKLWAACIKGRDKRCMRCGVDRGLQAAHIFSRSQKSTRWDMRNGITLCYGCHIFWAHKNPVEFVEYIKTRLGSEYEPLRLKAKEISLSISGEQLLEVKKELEEIIKKYEIIL